MFEKIMLVVGIIIAIIKGIAELIKLVEAPGFGPEKKEAVLKLIGNVYDEINKELPLPVSKERVLSIASTAIDILVGIYNLTGIFRTKNNTQTTPNN